ncbi:hypothetical protein DI392_07725 [Vibrio albus]|uniref:Uncharacterized protein n=1 Tax=Vibrio albus TaxID=2200953 RepID=A0A2U3BBG5_9VIBR|nr:hypothetical protein [Vibrio albus]PWI34075.1 hypothetical protein DI392_07725 [Vibrio albus]
MSTTIDIVINYIFKGEPLTLTTTNRDIQAEHFDPLDQSTFEKELIDYLVTTHYESQDCIELSVNTLRSLLYQQTSPTPCSTTEYARFFGLEQIIATVRGYCFPLAA